MLFSRTRFIYSLCLCLLIISAGSSRGVSEASPKAARSMLICYFSSPMDYQSRSAGAAVARMMRYRASNLPQLSNLPPLNVVERVLQQEGLLSRLSLDMPDAIRVAKASGQEWAVIGSVRRENKRFIFELRIYRAATGRSIGKPVIAGGKAEDLPLVERDLSKLLFGGIGLRLTQQQRAELGKPLTANYRAIRYLGDFLLANEKVASGLLDKALTADPKFPVSAVHRVDRALESGRYSDAIAIAREWRTRLPANRDFASYEFGALLAKERYSEAAKLLKTLDSDYPDSFSVTLLRHWLCRLSGDYDGSLQAACRLAALNPSSAEAHARMCIAYLERAIHTGSNLYLSQMDPEQASSFASAISCSCEAGETAVQLDPKYQQVWAALMIAYREKGDYGKCEAAFHRLMGLDAGSYEARVRQALAYLCQDRIRPARNLLEEAAKTAPARPDAVLALAVCCRLEGDSRSAATQYRQATSIDKRFGDAAYLRCQRQWPVQLAQMAGSIGGK